MNRNRDQFDDIVRARILKKLTETLEYLDITLDYFGIGINDLTNASDLRDLVEGRAAYDEKVYSLAMELSGYNVEWEALIEKRGKGIRAQTLRHKENFRKIRLYALALSRESSDKPWHKLLEEADEERVKMYGGKRYKRHTLEKIIIPHS